jgi:hypothetical protein
VEEKIGRRIVSDKQVQLPVIVIVQGGNSQTELRRHIESCFHCHIRECPVAFVPIESVSLRFQTLGAAHDLKCEIVTSLSSRRIHRGWRDVVDYVKIETAVIVIIKPG